MYPGGVPAAPQPGERIVKAQAPTVTTSCGSFAPSLLLYQAVLLEPSLSANEYVPFPPTAPVRSNSTQVPSGAPLGPASSAPAAGIVVHVIVPSLQLVSA